VAGQKWHADDYNRRGDERPRRQDQVKHYAESDESDEPRESVTSSETTLHDSAIGLKTHTS
jgi:hypothetical protein